MRPAARSHTGLRVAAIILREQSVALIERRCGGNLYYLFPGGAVEEGEALERAVVREAHEELGLITIVDRLVAEVSYMGNIQFYFLAHFIGGVFGTGTGAEILGLGPPENGTYTPVWMPAGDLLQKPVYPRAVAEVIARAIDEGWPAAPLKFLDPGREAC